MMKSKVSTVVKTGKQMTISIQSSSRLAIKSLVFPHLVDFRSICSWYLDSNLMLTKPAQFGMSATLWFMFLACLGRNTEESASFDYIPAFASFLKMLNSMNFFVDSINQMPHIWATILAEVPNKQQNSRDFRHEFIHGCRRTWIRPSHLTRYLITFMMYFFLLFFFLDWEHKNDWVELRIL